MAHVIDSALAANVGKVVVACDGPRLAAVAAAKGVETAMPRGNFICGSERVAATYKMLDGGEEVVINLQGDIPFFPPSTLAFALNCLGSADIATLVSPLTAEGMNNPNNVKAAVNWDEGTDRGEATDFSREAIAASDGGYYLHHGIYCFTAGVLERFASLPASARELAENLEQLRAIAAEMRIAVGLTAGLHSIDSPEDLAQIIMARSA